MPRPPYMSFPFPVHKNYYKPYPNYPPLPQNALNNNLSNKTTAGNLSSTQTHNDSHTDFDAKNKSNKYVDDYLFDLFGLKIFSDDILLVSLIYFLYSEGVKDDGLFIVLILLLLS